MRILCVAALLSCLGCGSPKRWEYALDTITRMEVEQRTIEAYHRLRGKPAEGVGAMSAKAVEELLRKMAEEMKAQPQLARKLLIFSSELVVGRLNQWGAAGWDLVQVEFDQERFLLIFKRPLRGRPMMPLEIIAPGEPGAGAAPMVPSKDTGGN